MSNRKKSKGGPSLSRTSSVTLSQEELLAREERNRDELMSMSAIFDGDYKLITDTPGEPLHFQIVVKPLPNESEAANYCSVLLDVMLTTNSTPLLVVRKQKSLGDAQVEQLQQATTAEAERLIAKGEEAIIYSVVTFMQEWLLPYNVAPKSFHEQMVEREQREIAEQKQAAQEKQHATRAAQNQEKELLKRSIEDAQKKKEEALVKKQELLRKPTTSASSSSLMPSRSLNASPASSPLAQLTPSPPFLPSLTLGAAALNAPTKKSPAAASSSTSHVLATPSPASAIPASKKSANMKIPEAPSKKSSLLNSIKAPVVSKPVPSNRHDAKQRLEAKQLDKKKSGRHKPRELKERSHDGATSEEEEDDEDDDSEEDEEDAEEDDEDESQSDASELSEAEESLFSSPGTSFDKKKGQPISDIDKLMAALELRESKTEKLKAAAASKKKLQRKHNSDSESENETATHDQIDDESEEDEEDEEEDDESEEEEEDLTRSPAIGPTGTAWLERNTSGNSDLQSATPAPPPAVPALPYYSRFHADFDQLELLGKGGFGEVYKVRNKIDQLFYAVKRIKLKKKNPAQNRKIVKEVSMIAMLHHRYIVRYYQAWIEGEEAPADEPTKSDSNAPKKPPLLHRKSTTTTAKTDFNEAEDDEDWLSPSHPSTMGGRDQDEDDEDEDEDEEDEEPARAAQLGQQYLYLQMEYCLNMDHQVLTNRGFLFLKDIQAISSDPSSEPLLFASYHPTTNQLEYSPASRIIVNPPGKSMIEMTQSNESKRWAVDSDEFGRSTTASTAASHDDEASLSNGVSVIVTDDHDMYVQLGKGGSNQSIESTTWHDSFNKLKASSLPSSNPMDRVRFLACSDEGIKADTNFEFTFINQLNLQSTQQIESFLELYGYWLVEGSMDIVNGCISFSPKQSSAQEWVENHLRDLKLELNQHFYSYHLSNGQFVIQIHEPAWVEYFSVQPNLRVTEEATTPNSCGPWVWQANKSWVQRILAGLQYAAGNGKQDVNEISTSSVRFRDEIQRLCIHGGYAAQFSLQYAAGDCREYDMNGQPFVANHDSWSVRYYNRHTGERTDNESALPSINRNLEVKKLDGSNSGSWCVTVPTGYIMVRRAFAKGDTVTKASLPIIIGNCPGKTLRDMIDEKLSEEDCWRLFRQLLEAVAYIHKRGILHRDLKPPNVFIAYSDNVPTIKLGDFGLAVLSSSNSNSTTEGAGGLSIPDKERSVSDLAANGLSRQSSITECVGTHFYSAPEQRASGVNYDHRVDMYSIGIIFFEMMYPFNSLMERALQLEELRTTGKVPNEFLVGRPNRMDIINIIESLLKHRPEDRPSAQDLLKSGLIPLKIEDEYMEHALKSVSQRDSAHHTRLLDILFSMPPDDHIDFTFDYLSVSSRADAQLNSHQGNTNVQTFRDAPLHFHQLVQMKVFDTVSNIFRNHGAIYLSTPIITPKSNIGATKTNTAIYLDPQGTIIKLPYTLTVPFARYIAQQSAWTWSGAAMASSASAALDGSMDSNELSSDGSDPDYHFDLRRYDISKVYRKNIIGGRPKELYECDFDIVWSNPYANTNMTGLPNYKPSLVGSMSSNSLSHLKDARFSAREKLCCLSAEVVRLTHEVLTEFVPAIGTSFIIKVNHSDLFDAILDVVLADSASLTKSKKEDSANNSTSLSQAAIQARREDQALLRHDLCKLASSYVLFQGSWSKSPMRKQLLREKKLSAKKIDLLGALFQLKSEPGQPDTIFQKIRDTLFSIPEARHVLNEQAILEQLDFIRNVFAYLKLFHQVEQQVIFDISVSGKHELYSGGIVFQALVPNSNTDLGSANLERPTSSPTDDISTSSTSAFSSSRSEPITQNAYETIALGGQYDKLIASFMPPTSSVPLSAVGVNFAIEKIVNAVVTYQMKHQTKSSASNTAIARRIKKSLYGGDAHSSNILLFSSKNAMLKERVTLANDLWTDNLPCLYLHPPHLTHSNVKLYAKEYMIRWLVLFKRNEFREKSQVQVIDLASGTSSSRSLEKSSNAIDNVLLSVNEVSSFIRGRMLGKRAETEMIPASVSSTSHTNSSAHAHSHQHSKPSFFCHIIDANNMKASVKNQLLTQVKRCLNTVLATANPASFAVTAVDLPFPLIRSLTSAFYLGPQQVQTVIEESHAKQRSVCDQLAAYMTKKCPSVQHLDSLTTSSGKVTAKEKQALALAAAETAKERVEVLYIYSIPDRKADMILCT